MPPKKPDSSYQIPQNNHSHQPNSAGNFSLDSIPRFHNPNSQTPSHHAKEMTKPAEASAQPVHLQPPKAQHVHAKINLSPKTVGHSQALPPDKKANTKAKLTKLRKTKHFKTFRFAFVSFCFFILLFNFQFIYSQVIYRITPKPANQSAVIPEPAEPNPIAAQAEVVGPENLIIIPKINVSAPLVFTDSIKEQDVLRALQDGVAHYAGTANPGENGNAVFFGHSSNDIWEKGNYKFVFVLLEKLAPGDEYAIHYQSRKYVYKVESTKVVEANDLTVLAQTDTPYSTLITCTPPGTAWRRFIVKARQILPSTNAAGTRLTNNTNSNVPPEQNTVLPSAAPSIFEQLVIGFQALVNSLLGRPNELKPSEENPSNDPVNRLPEVSSQIKMPTTF